MLFKEIVGHQHVKNHLLTSASHGRIPHAQLFVGPEGCGILRVAIAYAQYVLCQNKDFENQGGIDSCNIKFDHFSHPDLHFVYPTVTTEDVKSKPKSLDFLPLWREFLLEKPYGGLFDWYDKLGVGNKQGEIRVEDASEILKSLALKSYEGGYKILIIWMADKMNVAASNKLLKLLEEPTDKTLFILITENEEDLLQTIRSRCQVINFGKLSESAISRHLVEFEGIEEKEAMKIAHKSQGNYNKALQLSHHQNEDAPFEQWFVNWVRAAFRAKGNASAIQDLINWSEEIAKLGRENQKKFLTYCIELFRQALLLNYEAGDLVYYESGIQGFDLKKFAPFITGRNINEIYKELNDAIYHIERNGNSKIILTDLSIKLTRLIHKN
ncbi:DNA polymerase III subunit [Flavobacterium oreochromis]|uniref:DNA polymerase III subunit delta n=2 Tax=Flavobacterium TaxID=237 RepID=A0A246G8E2_9FLAO|nr:DNA polymerase III subunit delta' [Flavobacterium oreochromis]OWP74246.1 DNA polymerase III subunit delta' [Flavobacterium oreochromis]OWP75178.1 DNA polymerase III subunit delta' [Flavobacterium oreochromis]POR18122.1 DNA polymerase III subunit delta' [Flavobacterium columnare]QYS87311.1 DNA polymerase III subunit delta' [Flavobacterium oreochromis]